MVQAVVVHFVFVDTYEQCKRKEMKGEGKNAYDCDVWMCDGDWGSRSFNMTVNDEPSPM